mgnify:FL=1
MLIVVPFVKPVDSWRTGAGILSTNKTGDEMSKCKSCNKNLVLTDILINDVYAPGEAYYHEACHKSKMDSTNYVDAKMDVTTYPISYNAPSHDEARHDQLSSLYSVLGGSKATVWVEENIYQDVDMKSIYQQIMEGELTYNE